MLVLETCLTIIKLYIKYVSHSHQLHKCPIKVHVRNAARDSFRHILVVLHILVRLQECVIKGQFHTNKPMYSYNS